ncbi:hypothetical protein PoB_001765800 [Plakobranchus ocellatus]|uniref:Uncharacterized protein n=1 Tax=Plakobranchus ocellatus TaxID=259542 RepID=A0AAV3Z966_9GAST|nr:hypothetical protein PoB_001765800 [Plakobranchus ocellatus]
MKTSPSSQRTQNIQLTLTNSNHNAGEESDPSAQQPDLSSEQKVLVCNSTLEMEVLASSSCQDLSETPGPCIEAADLPTIQPRKRKRQPENWRKNVSKKKEQLDLRLCLFAFQHRHHFSKRYVCDEFHFQSH